MDYAERARENLQQFEQSLKNPKKHQKYMNPLDVLHLGEHIVEHAPEKLKDYLDLIELATKQDFFNWKIFVPRQEIYRIDGDSIRERISILKTGEETLETKTQLNSNV